MLTVTVQNPATGRTYYSGPQADQDALDAWIAQCEADEAFGRNQRQVTSLPDGSVPGEDVSKATSSTQVTLTPEHKVQNADGTETDVAAVTATQYTFPADYTIGAPVDITAQIAQQQAVAKGLRAIAFCNGLVAQIWAMNTANAVSIAQMKTMTADAAMQQIFTAIGTGSVNTLHDLLKNLTATYFTQDQINGILSQIEASEFYETPAAQTTSS